MPAKRRTALCSKMLTKTRLPRSGKIDGILKTGSNGLTGIYFQRDLRFVFSYQNTKTDVDFVSR